MMRWGIIAVVILSILSTCWARQCGRAQMYKGLASIQILRSNIAAPKSQEELKESCSKLSETVQSLTTFLDECVDPSKIKTHLEMLRRASDMATKPCSAFPETVKEYSGSVGCLMRVIGDYETCVKESSSALEDIKKMDLPHGEIPVSICCTYAKYKYCYRSKISSQCGPDALDKFEASYKPRHLNAELQCVTYTYHSEECSKYFAGIDFDKIPENLELDGNTTPHVAEDDDDDDMQPVEPSGGDIDDATMNARLNPLSLIIIRLRHIFENLKKIVYLEVVAMKRQR